MKLWQLPRKRISHVILGFIREGERERKVVLLIGCCYVPFVESEGALAEKISGGDQEVKESRQVISVTTITYKKNEKCCRIQM